MTKDSYLKLLDRHIFDTYRTRRKAAAAWGVSGSAVTKVMRGDMRPTDSMLLDTGHEWSIESVVTVSRVKA